MSASRAIISVRAATGTRPVAGRFLRQSPMQTRTAAGLGGSRPDDLGGPGGQEDPFRRVGQNRRSGLITAGALLTAIAGTWMFTGKGTNVSKQQYDAAKAGAVQGVEEHLDRQEKKPPAEKGLRSFRTD